jgi:hypothetical protein
VTGTSVASPDRTARPEHPQGADGSAHLSRRAAWVICLVAVLFAGSSLRQAWTDGPTFDEANDLASSLAALTRHDLRANPQHPPLFRTVAAIPVLFLDPTIPDGAAWDRASGHDLAVQFMHHEVASGHLQRDLFAARVVPVLEAVAIAWLLALLAGRLLGGAAGVFSAVLWLVNPLVIGLGHVDGIDLSATLTTVLTALAVLAARRDPTRRRVALVGLCGGLAILTRLTGVLVVLLAAAAVAAAGWRGARRRPLLDASLVVAVAWATAMVVYAALSPVDIGSAGHGVAAVVGTVGHVVVPPAWLRGTEHLWRVGSTPGPAFVLGEAHTGRWLWFWPASLVVKLPPTTLAVLVAGPLAWVRLPRAVRREAAWVVALPALALTLFTVQQQRPIGLRYLLPALALWIVAAAPIVVVLGRRAARTVVALAVAGGLAASLVTPSLASTNPLLGPGYRVATDSNLDWGQSYPALRRWSPSHHPWVAYFGAPGLGVDTLPGARDLADAPADLTGWVAVSASLLTAYDRDELGWLRAYCPVAVIARTVLVYRFTTPPERARPGPEAPRGPCAGSTSRLASRSNSPDAAAHAGGTPS